MKYLKRILPKPIKMVLKRIWNSAKGNIITYIGNRYNLIYLAQREAEKKFFKPDPSEIGEIIGDQKINVFDIGARGGMESEWDKYTHLLDIILVEPDPVEAKELEKKGYKVIQKLLGAQEGKSVLNIGQRGGTSSILEPTGSFLELYTSGNSKRFNVVDKVEVNMTTIARVMQEQGGQIDYMKLDTQGTELDIISGFGEFRPLFIKTEISFVPLYQDSALFFDLGKKLYEMGYILFHTTHYARSSPEKHISNKPFSETVLPTHGDAWFCPDWTRKEGQKIIKGREKQYKALMKIFGLQDVFSYAFPEL